jgi:hypothetical protein
MAHYGTLSGAEDYHTARGNSAWPSGAPTEAARTAALVRASVALDGQYGGRYPGTKAGGRSQALGWPRSGAIDHCAGEEISADAVPVEIENAAYELALIELVTPGASTPAVVPGQIVQSEAIGPISTSYFQPGQGAATGIEAQRQVLFAVEDALRCIIKPDNRGKLMFGKAIRG